MSLSEVLRKLADLIAVKECSAEKAIAKEESDLLLSALLLFWDWCNGNLLCVKENVEVDSRVNHDKDIGFRLYIL